MAPGILLGAPLSYQAAPTKTTALVIHMSREGFTVSADFEPHSPGDKTRFSAQRISLTFGPGTTPYFDPDALGAIFIKLIGPPDTTDTDHDHHWGLVGKDRGSNIDAYRYGNDFWVILERPRKVTNEHASPPDEKKDEKTKGSAGGTK
jgi:hypothetical protein